MKPADLIRIRRRLGWSQTDLAEALGVRQASISRWETGERRIPPFLAMALRTLTGKAKVRPAQS